MAVTDKTQTSSTQAQTENTMAGAFAQARENSQSTGKAGIRLSAGLSSQLLGIRLSSGTGGDTTGKFIQTANKYLEKETALAAQGLKTVLIPLNVEDNPSLGVSAVLIINTLKDVSVMGAHVVLMAGSIDPLQDKMVSCGPGVGTVGVKQFVSDAIRPVFMEIVKSSVTQISGQYRVVFSDSEVFLAEWDAGNSEQVDPVVINAIAANVTEISKAKGLADLDLTQVKNDGALVVSPTFNNPNLPGPVRADVRIPFNVVPRGLDAQNDGFARSARVSDVGLFMDLIYNGTGNQQMLGQNMMQNQQAQKIYIAQAVITSLRIPNNCYTTGSVLMALATTMSVIQGNAWIQAFKKQHVAGNKLDLTDIGAVGVDLNWENNQSGIGAPIDTSSAAFTDAFLAQLLNTIVSGVQISIDVPECGKETFYTSIFGAAAAGNAGAQRDIFNAANQLTGGNFAKFFNPADSIVVRDNAIVLNGYYTDANHERRDIRQIDYLAVMNMAIANGDYTMVENWCNSLYNVDMHPAQALFERALIIQNIAGDVTFTGRSRRVTFTDSFINAFAEALTRTDVRFDVQNTGIDMRSQQRAVPGQRFAGAVLSQGNFGGFMNRGIGTGNTGFTFGRRW